MSCSGCGCSKIVNVKYNLCDDCNHKRLHKETKFDTALRKQKIVQSKPKKRHKHQSGVTHQRSIDRRSERLKNDENTYFEVFNSQKSECAECQSPLPDTFRDEEGNIIARYQYSHILGKGAFPKYRNKAWNFRRVCLSCHQLYEFGDRKSMKIYEECKQIVIENTGFDLLK